MHSTWIRTCRTFGLLSLLAASALTPNLAWAVDGLTYASGLSPSSSEPTRTAEAFCPNDTRAIGGGAIFSGSNKLVIEAAFPREHSFVVTAAEPAGGIPNDWYIVALAICAPERSLPGLERVEILGRTSGEIVSYQCPSGKTLIGLGGRVNSDSLQRGFIALTGIRASSDLRTFTVQGGVDGPELGGGNWNLTAVGICADRVPGLTLVEGASALNATDRKTASASCPSGTKIHSLGFDF